MAEQPRHCGCYFYLASVHALVSSPRCEGVHLHRLNISKWCLCWFSPTWRCRVMAKGMQGSYIELGELVYEPLRDGPTLWEIGIPDRSAAEFYAPDPNPQHINKLFINHLDRFGQYGLWDGYSELYPDGDLVYTIGVSDYTKDWFYAQAPRKKQDNTLQ
ncbi:hypothetical protein GLYMA_04G091132v4 [Glycine max]|nr:hypothetical protein GLYMA_04G091132v4 [Glycine max]KAH1110550.1 hypothetical protein GYH30_009406 [Glycine max]